MTSIGTLPDDALLEIFNFHLYGQPQTLTETEKGWQSLVRVCRRWRRIVFGSPRHLNLELVCTIKTRVRDTLGIWPALPLIILCQGDYRTGSVDNIIAVFEHRDRVRQVALLAVPSSDLEIILAAMQQPLPELTNLWILSKDGTVPVVPNSFLGGSAPLLRHFSLDRIPFPGLLNLLLSATHLVSLHLDDIPHSGYFSPDTMVTALSTLTSLNFLWLKFRSPRSCPDPSSRHLPPSTRSVLPVLNSFWFKGVSEYLEEFVACIDTPQLECLSINFFNDIVFNIPHFSQFVDRTPMSRALENTHIVFWHDGASVNSSFRPSRGRSFEVKILCKAWDSQVSFLEQACTSFLPRLSTLQDLYIYEYPRQQPDWTDRIENWLWLELLHPFTAVKNLYLSRKLAPLIAPALQELVERRMTEELPVLQNIFFEGLESSGSVQEGIAQFVAARQGVSHPMAVSHWANSKEDKIRKSGH